MAQWNIRDPLERFWEYIEFEPNSGCWLWIGATGRWGYGNLYVFGVVTPAHRFAYQSLVGPIPSGLYVCHRCDVKCCVNPDHLFLGTPKDNTADAMQKGLMLFGERHPSSRLRSRDVLEIRCRAVAGETHASLAAAFGVGASQITRIVRRVRWASVQTEEIA